MKITPYTEEDWPDVVEKLREAKAYKVSLCSPHNDREISLEGLNEYLKAWLDPNVSCTQCANIKAMRQNGDRLSIDKRKLMRIVRALGWPDKLHGDKVVKGQREKLSPTVLRKPWEQRYFDSLDSQEWPMTA